MGFSLHESFTKKVIGISVEDQRGKSKTKSCKNILKRKTQSSQVQIMFLLSIHILEGEKLFSISGENKPK